MLCTFAQKVGGLMGRRSGPAYWMNKVVTVRVINVNKDNQAVKI